MGEINRERRKYQRRQFIRVHSKYIFSYKIIQDRLSEEDVAYTEDLGMGGMHFNSDKEFPEGVFLEIELHLPDFSGVLKIIGTVLESEKIKETKNHYNIRLKFVKVKESDLGTFKKIIDFLWQQHKITAKFEKRFNLDRRK
ncbi:MAG: PilZ domain-containing protein [Candidatus Omnitrophota bacterium]